MNSLFWFIVYLISDRGFDYCRIDKVGVSGFSRFVWGVLNEVGEEHAYLRIVTKA